MKNKLKAFTLIELLVVVGIIAILAAVVITATNTARMKGDNASISKGLDTIRKQAEIYYTINNYKYGTTAFNNTSISSDCSSAVSNFFADPTIVSVLSQVGKSSGGATKNNMSCVFNQTKSAWIFSVLMKNTGNISGVWCVDSRGGGINKYPSATMANDTTNVLDLANSTCK